MTLKVNFTNVADRGPAKPKGWYRVRITDGEVKVTGEKAKNPNLEYINVELTIQEGEYAGKKFFVGLHPLIENALGIVKGFLRATGRYTQAQLDGTLEWDSWEEFMETIDGAEIMVHNVPREYEGDMTDNIKPNFKSVEGNSGSPTTVDAGSTLLP